MAVALDRAVAGFGGLLILEYQKSSAAKASHCAALGMEVMRVWPLFYFHALGWLSIHGS